MNANGNCAAPENLKEMMRVVMAQQLALRIALTSILRTYPEAEEALRYFDFISEAMKASFLHSQWSEERINDFEFHLTSLRNDLTQRSIIS